LTFHNATWIKNLHASHLVEWRFLLVKRASLKIIRKISFQVSGGQSGPLGRTVHGLLNFILILEFLAKVFENIRFRADCPRTPGGRSVILYRTGCCSGDQADGPRRAHGESAWPRRTVRVALADGPPGPTVSPPAVDFAFLLLEFKRGTVHEARVLSLTASNGKGEYLYTKPGVGELLLAL
jgi:hypothetical protein